MGLVARQCVESSQTRDQTRVPCIGTWKSCVHNLKQSYIPESDNYEQVLQLPVSSGTYDSCVGYGIILHCEGLSWTL